MVSNPVSDSALPLIVSNPVSDSALPLLTQAQVDQVTSEATKQWESAKARAKAQWKEGKAKAQEQVAEAKKQAAAHAEAGKAMALEQWAQVVEQAVALRANVEAEAKVSWGGWGGCFALRAPSRAVAVTLPHPGQVAGSRLTLPPPRAPCMPQGELSQRCGDRAGGERRGQGARRRRARQRHRDVGRGSNRRLRDYTAGRALRW